MNMEEHDHICEGHESLVDEDEAAAVLAEQGLPEESGVEDGDVSENT